LKLDKYHTGTDCSDWLDKNRPCKKATFLTCKQAISAEYVMKLVKYHIGTFF